MRTPTTVLILSLLALGHWHCTAVGAPVRKQRSVAKLTEMARHRQGLDEAFDGFIDITGTTGSTGSGSGSRLQPETEAILASGASGATGSTGSTGGTGATGLTGSTGGTGATGMTGATGAHMAPLDDCSSALRKEEARLAAQDVSSSVLHHEIGRWCRSLFKKRSHFKISSYTVERICNQAEQIFFKRPNNTRYSKDWKRENEFCMHMRASFDKILAIPETHKFEKAKPPITPKDTQHLPVAKTVNWVGKDGTCCMPHAAAGCAEDYIKKCVCKHDKACCEKEWDLQCVDQVETFLCASCPRPA